MLFGLLLVLVLGGALLVRRAPAGDAGVRWAGNASTRARWIGAVVVLAGSLPLLRVAPFVHGPTRILFGDSASHAAVARDIARDGLPHGWIATFMGGFPFGHHYPPLGWLTLAGLIRLGSSPPLAVHALGWAAVVATPLTLYAALVRARARPSFVAVGALFLSWVNPYNPFVGGYEAFFTSGLVSQVLALPLCVALVGAVACGGALETATLSALAIAAHPQLTLSTLLVTGAGALGAGRREPLLRTLRAGLSAFAVGAALYGQGIFALDIPFGWPPGFGWRQLGFGTRRWAWWFWDGDLLDYRSGVAVLTALGGAAVVALLLCARRPAARAALIASVAALLASAAGPLLSNLSGFGSAVLGVLQPLRLLALFPALGATLVVIALEEALPLVALALSRLGLVRLAAYVELTTALATGGLVAGALPGRLHALELPARMLARPRGSACVEPPAGYQPDAWRSELRALRGGELWFDQRDTSLLGICFEHDGLGLESGVPLGSTTAVGSHVGMAWLVAKQLAPERAGVAKRARALGIRYLVTSADAPTPEGFEVRARRGNVVLLSTRTPTDVAGAGCVTEHWRGTEAELRARLTEELILRSGPDRVLDPQTFVALEHGTGGLTESAASESGCDASRAHVTSRTLEPGAIEATVDADTPVDVVLRVSWFPTWQATLDGAPAGPLQRVAPGYPALRVPAGHHRLVVTASTLPGYCWLLGAGLLGATAAGTLSRQRLTALLRALRREKPPS